MHHTAIATVSPAQTGKSYMAFVYQESTNAVNIAKHASEAHEQTTVKRMVRGAAGQPASAFWPCQLAAAEALPLPLLLPAFPHCSCPPCLRITSLVMARFAHVTWGRLACPTCTESRFANASFQKSFQVHYTCHLKVGTTSL